MYQESFLTRKTWWTTYNKRYKPGERKELPMQVVSARIKPKIPAIPINPPGPARAPRKGVYQAIKNPEESFIENKPQVPNPRFRPKVPKTTRTITPVLSPIVENGPITPHEAIQKYSALLTSYEKSEIKSFPEIYYIGMRSIKHDPPPHTHSSAFDDRNHNYRAITGDHLAYRFEIINILGSGAFGQVIRCFDHKNKVRVAVKMNISTNQMIEQGKIEARILAHLCKNEPPNIVRAYDFFVFRSHICITFEILGKNLYEVSQINSFKPMPMQLVRIYAKQILQGLEMCHKNGVIHCDIKPENILLCLDKKTAVKIIDFGSSCFSGHQIYEYIQSRYYRAPEVILGISYGTPMDIWSFALVIVEILIGRPLFPGENELDQLSLISQVIGPPPTNLVRIGKRRSDFFDDTYHLKQSKNVKSRKPNSLTMTQAVGINDPLLSDFLLKCLTWDQSTRISSSEALSHEWINVSEITIHQKPHSTLPDLKF